MIKSYYKVESNEKIAKSVYKMVLSGDTSAITRPGQFINIKVPDKYLRRPISVCDFDADTVTVIYKVVGEGTKIMSEMEKGISLDVLTGLGNGFDIGKSGDRPLLIGGGVGVPPLYNLAKKLKDEGKTVTVILGFNTSDEVFLKEEFEKIATVYLTTADGSEGQKGFVTDAMDGIDYDYIYTCGPQAMLRAVYDKAMAGGQFSFEERMGCGFGACMGCSCKTKYGAKRICKDGPVLEKEEIIW